MKKKNREGAFFNFPKRKKTTYVYRLETLQNSLCNWWWLAHRRKENSFRTSPGHNQNWICIMTSSNFPKRRPRRGTRSWVTSRLFATPRSAFFPLQYVECYDFRQYEIRGVKKKWRPMKVYGSNLRRPVTRMQDTILRYNLIELCTKGKLTYWQHNHVNLYETHTKHNMQSPEKISVWIRLYQCTQLIPWS